MLIAFRRPRSLRLRFLLVMIGGVLIPLALVGLWLAGGIERSGETVLRARLEGSLNPIVADIGTRWVQVRGEILTAAAGGPQTGSRSEATGEDGDPARGVTITLPLYSGSGDSIGSVTRRLPISDLLPSEANAGSTVGAVLAVFDRATGASLLSLPLDPALLQRDEFSWGGERWLVVHRVLNEPPIHLASAAPLEPYMAPLRSAARSGAVALAFVAAGVLLLTTVVTGRLTRSLENLADAADAVAQGDLERHVRANGNDEVGRLGRAFNSMTANLRQTLRDLAQRQSLAAVGEFAASLAHEVRNPLTSIRIDLQRAEEQLPADSDLRAPLSRALTQVTRLDRTVAGALRVARGGSVEARPLSIRGPIERAMHAASPAFADRGAGLEPLTNEPDELYVTGDAGALEQVFINLLLNAAQALSSGGRAGVHVSRSDDLVDISVWDTGPGMPPDAQARAFQPFYSTKQEGTGLGLAVARQIVLAHLGEIGIESTPGAGTRVMVRLPGAKPSAFP